MGSEHFAVTRDVLVQAEGLKLHPYRCTAGKLTIGVGRNLEDNGISTEEAMLMLDTDIQTAEHGVRTKIKNFDELTDARKAVLISLCFNVGYNRFYRFAKMIAAVNAGDFNAAADELIESLWYEQVGNRGPHHAAAMRLGTLAAREQTKGAAQ